MSRIGKKPIEIPKGVKISIADGSVTIEGSKGTLTQATPPSLEVTFDEDSRRLMVASKADAPDKMTLAMWGTVRALIQNMVKGVSEGYTKKLEIVGVGWGAQLAGQKLSMKLGFANAVEVPIPSGVNVEVEKQHLTVTGADKQAVGQFAAVVRSKRKPEPYNGKGIKYADEVIRRKQGKQFGS